MAFGEKGGGRFYRGFRFGSLFILLFHYIPVMYAFTSEIVSDLTTELCALFICISLVLQLE